MVPSRRWPPGRRLGARGSLTRPSLVRGWSRPRWSCDRPARLLTEVPTPPSPVLSGPGRPRKERAMVLASERVRVAHLLRRAGFGTNEQELDDYTRLGFDGAISRLIEYESQPD